MLKNDHSALLNQPSEGATARPSADAPAEASARPSVWPLVVILLLGAVVRLVLWLPLQDKGLDVWDERDYNTLAKGLVERGEFAYLEGKPIALRPPLYPLFVATVYRVFGLENFQAVRLIQAGLSLLSVVLLYRLGCLVFSRKVALWAAGLFCFYPSLLGANNFVLTETLFIFFLIATLYALAVAFTREQLIYLAVAGVLLGLAALTRSVLWLFPPVLIFILLATWKTGWKRRLAGAALVCLGFALTIAPWSVRNSRLEKTFVAVDTMGGRNFMMGNYEHTPMYRAWDAISMEGEQSWDHALRAAHPPGAWETQGQKDKLALRYGIQFALANPGLTAQRCTVKFFHFWGLEREIVAGAARGQSGALSKVGLLALTAVIFGSYVAVMVSGVYGVTVTPPKDRRMFWTLLLTVLFICAAHTAVFGHSRYHLPVMPLVMLFSASALCQLRAVWAQKRSWRFWLGTGVVAVFLCGWAWEVFVVDFHQFLNAMRSAA